MIADVIANYPFDQTARISCPECTPERRKQRSKDMTLTRKPDGAIVYHCHHCGANGSVQPKKQEITLSAVALYRDWETDRKSTRLNSSHSAKSRMPSSA